ncbi:glycosyltransferase [Botryobacter ruber]|uniref:glycosyltransferase n=1 Tax=Botryobacter ruber TaxID=2171629 RepID=UPI000E0C90F3|nr:glycosyltransferase [Botryobacter ruber]
MTLPLVSVICLCYNHERFIAEALDSVLAQTYPNLEIIIVDDCSTDNSVALIEAYCRKHPQLRFISTGHNRGNCAAFNMGFRASSGAFLIDFATDDVLLPDRIEKQVAAFTTVSADYGVVYSDAEYIDDDSRHLGYHCQRDAQGNVTSFAPSGDIFSYLVARYFICPPTMFIRREVLEELNGYDETLAYEDFDFWVRSSRHYKYYFLDEVTTKRRVHAHAMSRGWYRRGNRLLGSTVKVCEKAMALVQTPEEEAALAQRLQYEARQAYFTGNFTEAEILLNMLQLLQPLPPLYRVLRLFNKYKINLSSVRHIYYRLKYKR